jgi:preprotein translocase subunit SecD
MKKRCDLLGIHCEVERFGGDHGSRIKIKILGSVNPEHTKKILLSQGEDLEMRAVVSPPSPSPVQTYPTDKEAAAAAGADLDVLPYTETADDKQGTINRFVVVERTPIITGADVREAEAAPGYIRDKYQINFTLTPAGAGRFGRWTGANINHYLAVVLNKQVRSVAYIKGQINDMGQITGKFTKQQAEDTAMLLMSGSLPVPIEAIEEGTD